MQPASSGVLPGPEPERNNPRTAGRVGRRSADGVGKVMITPGATRKPIGVGWKYTTAPDMFWNPERGEWLGQAITQGVNKP